MATYSDTLDKPIEKLVLVVDDDLRVRESLTGLLNSAGIKALCFDSAEALLQSDALAASSCLITDLRMSGMDGWELQAIVANIHPHVRTIFNSAFQDQEALERAMALDGFAFLYKPSDGEELLHTIEAALCQSAGY